MAGESSKELTIGKLTDDKTGNYKCEARNDLGSVSIQFVVLLKEPAKIVSASEEFAEIDDGTKTFSCIMRGQPWPKVWWSDGETKFISTEKVNLISRFARSEESFLLDDKGNFHKNFNPYEPKVKYYAQLSKLDKGSMKFEIIFMSRSVVEKLENLKCHAINAFGIDEKLATSPLKFVDGQGAEVHRKIQNGKRAVFACDIGGFPKASLRWTFVSLTFDFIELV